MIKELPDGSDVASSSQAVVKKPRKITIIDFDNSDQWKEQEVRDHKLTRVNEGNQTTQEPNDQSREVAYRTSKYIRPLYKANGDIFYFKHTICAKGSKE